MQNLKESKPKKKELRCPFSQNPNFKCEDCRLFKEISKDVGKVCVLIYLAMRSS